MEKDEKSIAPEPEKPAKKPEGRPEEKRKTEVQAPEKREPKHEKNERKEEPKEERASRAEKNAAPRSRASRGRKAGAKEQAAGEEGEKKEGIQITPTMRAVILGVLIFAVLTAVLVAVWATADSSMFHGDTEQVPEEPSDSEEETPPDPPEEEPEDERLSTSMTPIAIDENSPFYEAFTSGDRVNVLLLGINQGMTDTIMLGSYDMENQALDIISVPRDTFYYRSQYANSSYAFQKINSIYSSEKSVTAVAEAVSSLLYGMPIHYYAIVEYDDIRKVVDAVGGVEIYVPFHMKYTDSTKGHELHVDIPEGNQVIDSSNVIEFLRFRHTNPSLAKQGYQSYQRGDIDRIEVQQDFVKAFIKKCLSLGNITNVAKVALDNVESDLTYAVAAKIAAKAVAGLRADSLNSYLLPGTSKNMHNLSFWVQNEEETYAMLETILHLNEEEAQPEEPAPQGEGEGQSQGEAAKP